MGAFPRWVSLYFCKLTLVFSLFFFQVQVWILTGPLQHPHSFLLQSFSAWQLIWGYVCTKDVIQEGLQLAEMQICKPKVCYHVLLRDDRLSPSNQPSFSWSNEFCERISFSYFCSLCVEMKDPGCWKVPDTPLLFFLCI